MKRFVFWFLVALLAFAWLGATRQRPAPARDRDWVWADGQAGRPGLPVVGPDGRPTASDDEFVGLGVKIIDDHGKRMDFYPDLVRDPERVPAEGLPVPVVPGSRVTEARVEVPRPGTPVRPWDGRRSPSPRPGTPVRPRPSPMPWTERDTIVVVGRLSATAERARNDALGLFRNQLKDILSPDVPRSWKVPEPLFRAVIRRVEVKTAVRDYGTLYEATLHADVSPRVRSEVVDAYHHEEVLKRLAVLGGLLTFVLICLAAVSGYIRADEATQGYYTNSLRLAAAAGVGAAGVVIYQILT